ERDLDHPEHPLSLAEHRLRESGGRLPEKLRNQLQRRILAARADIARTERDNGDLLDHVEICIESYAKNGDPRASS
ncbi:MAG: hypothetical protein V3T72_22665, partial [Thermoanaerobaculia bacterium]